MNSIANLRAFLSDSRHYDGGGPVELYETHGALVGVGGNTAIKVKKPVCFPYMDYSTPEKRGVLCQREVALNQRTAPQLYRDVRPIFQNDHGYLSFEGSTIVDYAIIMNRFDESTLLSEQKNLPQELCDKLASQIATFHQKESALSGIDGYTMMRGVVMGNDGCFAGYADILPREQTLSLTTACLDALEKNKALLQKRSQTFIKQCHGDLYLKNIYCAPDGQPILFDCIEFNDAFAQIDVAYDLAFLLMDLAYRDMQQEAWQVRHRYVQITGDYEGLLLMPVFIAMRAAIRSHVSMAIAGGITSGQQHFEQEGHRYLTFALACLKEKKGTLTAFGGYSGSGKTTLASAFAQDTGAILLSSDDLRKIGHGVAVTQSLPESAYTPEKSRAVYARLYDLAIQLAQTGQNVVLDATFLLSAGRAHLESLTKEHGMTFQGFWVEAPDHQAESSIADRVETSSDATIAIRRRQQQQDTGVVTWRPLKGHTNLNTLLQKIAS